MMVITSVVRWSGLSVFVCLNFAGLVKCSCSPNCADEPGNATGLSCNETTGECLYGCKGKFEGGNCNDCKRGSTGNQCQFECDYNCLKCTRDQSSGSVEVGCDLCYPWYYLEVSSGHCLQCRSNCLTNASSYLPTCDQTDGTCTFGCRLGWHGELCNGQCRPWCANRTCDRYDGCCTEGCTHPNFAGCRCEQPCNSNCKDGTCYQNKTCMVGCKLNHWEHDCSQVCSDSCTRGPDNSISVCDMNGTCVLGCKKTFMGPDCLDRCAINCLDRDCNETNGHCLRCEKGTRGDFCETNCSSNCLQTDCYRNNGTCQQGCLIGLHGSFCSKMCPENCLNSTCFRENGTCAFGCIEDLTGEECDVLVASKTTAKDTPTLKTILDPVFYTFAGLVLLGMTLFIIFKNRRKIKRFKLKNQDVSTHEYENSVLSTVTQMDQVESAKTPTDDLPAGENSYEAVQEGRENADHPFAQGTPISTAHTHSNTGNKITADGNVYEALQRQGVTNDHIYGDTSEASVAAPENNNSNLYQHLQRQNGSLDHINGGIAPTSNESEGPSSLHLDNSYEILDVRL